MIYCVVSSNGVVCCNDAVCCSVWHGMLHGMLLGMVCCMAWYVASYDMLHGTICCMGRYAVSYGMLHGTICCIVWYIAERKSWLANVLAQDKFSDEHHGLCRLEQPDVAVATAVCGEIIFTRGRQHEGNAGCGIPEQ